MLSGADVWVGVVGKWSTIDGGVDGGGGGSRGRVHIIVICKPSSETLENKTRKEITV